MWRSRRGSGSGCAVDLDVAAVEEDLQALAAHLAVFVVHPPPDRLRARDQLLHVDRLAHHVVDAGGEQLEGRIEAADFGQRDDRRVGAASDQPRQRRPVLAFAEQDRLYRVDIVRRCGEQPFAKFDVVAGRDWPHLPRGMRRHRLRPPRPVHRRRYAFMPPGRYRVFCRSGPPRPRRHRHRHKRPPEDDNNSWKVRETAGYATQR